MDHKKERKWMKGRKVKQLSAYRKSEWEGKEENRDNKRREIYKYIAGLRIVREKPSMYKDVMCQTIMCKAVFLC